MCHMHSCSISTFATFHFLNVYFRIFFHPDGFHENVPKRCEGVHCVDLDESFPTSIYLQNLASIQPRTSPKKFGKTGKRDFESSFALTPVRAFEIGDQTGFAVAGGASIVMKKHFFKTGKLFETLRSVIRCKTTCRHGCNITSIILLLIENSWKIV